MTTSLFAALAAATLLSACTQEKPIAETKAPVSAQSAAYMDSVAKASAPPADSTRTALYECPMQCKGGSSSKPGDCPTCGMALVRKS